MLKLSLKLRGIRARLNAAKGPGHAVSVAGTGSSLGARFAEMVQEEVCLRTDLTDCRTHSKTWDLLRMTRMPAVRIECGYLSSPRDARRLADPAFRDAVAEGIAAAVVRFFAPEEP